MLDAFNLTESIKQIAYNAITNSNPADVMMAIVTSAKPLKIQIEQNDMIQESQIIVPEYLTDHKVKIEIKKVWSTEIENGCSESPLLHSHKIEGEKEMIVKNALKSGDKVIILRLHGGQKFYVLDRVVNE